MASPTDTQRVNGSGYDGVAVTPSDTTDLGKVIGLYVGGTGDVSVVTEAGNTLVFSTVPAGLIIPIRCSKVKAATTATLIVAFK